MQNWNDFTEATKKNGVPGQNMVYADVMEILGGARCLYTNPKRRLQPNPRPGNKESMIGKVGAPFYHMPLLLTPTGVYCTANNKTIDDSFLII
ncbi:MAG: hypothetical protein Ct9H300mP2_4310 [Candidatus Neomarinimicrobiota bacterium]|nr:MAG: hypothetical protein Ct9H300mP2_4310 [Candidatus Neomarinimicrobiota bacterium]